VAPIVATFGLLDVQVTELVKYSVEPVVVVPTAVNWVVSPANERVCALGRTAITERLPTPPVPVPTAPTVTVAVAVTGPLNPCAVAVMVAMPTPTAVTAPVVPTTDATVGALEVHVTPVVTGWVV
jgi:hypothetical protein